MRDDQIPRLKKRSEAIEKSFDDLLKVLGQATDSEGRAFDVSRPLPTTDSSVSDLRARSAAIAGLIKKMDNKGGALTPLADFVAMVNSGNAVTNSITHLIDQLSVQISNSGGIQSLSYDTLSVNFRNGDTIDFQSQFKSVFDSIESYLASFQNIFQSVSPSRAAFNFSSATDSLSKIIGRANDVRESLQDALNQASKNLGKVNVNQSEFEAILSDVRTKQALLSEQYVQSIDAISNISARNTESAALNATTIKLKENVDAYKVDFENFQIQIDDMKASFQTGDERLKGLIGQFEEQSKSFEEMINRSDQMLSASTVAGLASEFGTIRNDLDGKLTGAHTSFNWSVVFLAVSALPLMLFVFSPFLVAILPENKNLVDAIAGMAAGQNSWHYIGQVLARFIILLPAIWYVSFCTARYNSLFKLKEHYSYKYSMAVAVDGFKKQAPEYQGMIAALVFEQLAFNPADKLGKKHDGPEGPPNPIAKLLLETLRKNIKED